MTNREFYTTISTTESLSMELRNHALAQLEKLDATAEKRKGKVSKADQEKRDANAALAAKVAAEVLTTEAKTATDVAAILTEMLGEEVKVQKASYLCRLAVDMGLAAQTEVKIPKKGTQKAYTIVG
jgi:protein-disulfide isomerase-like protein with CxxC motif